MATIMEALGGHNGDTIAEALNGNRSETIMEALSGSVGQSIMEAKGGHNGDTIMEVFGGKVGETIANVIENQDFEPSGVEYTVTYNVNGGTGSIEPVNVAVGSSITLNDGSGLTAPEGKQFLGWAKSATASSATVTSPFAPTKDTTLYAVWKAVE